MLPERAVDLNAGLAITVLACLNCGRRKAADAEPRPITSRHWSAARNNLRQSAHMRWVADAYKAPVTEYRPTLDLRTTPLHDKPPLSFTLANVQSHLLGVPARINTLPDTIRMIGW